MNPMVIILMTLLFGGAFFLQILGLMNLIPVILSSLILFFIIAGSIYGMTRKKTFKGF
ncbi:hypothetical protein J9317_06425 [Metabacillus sp. KIGAM252]|uniref:DUF5325 family protein n=1 Tax=Metabacillus flavus TaxID=2823519 RepID=A0ABS5LCT8_9BACI|nr:hypothetical protein [Metabacillus flavus]MBS2968393.1 hypothetical protein [Metabacillus flavus]